MNVTRNLDSRRQASSVPQLISTTMGPWAHQKAVQSREFLVWFSRCRGTQRDSTWLPFPFCDCFQIVVTVVFVNLHRASQGISIRPLEVSVEVEKTEQTTTLLCDLGSDFPAVVSGIERQELSLQCHNYFPIMNAQVDLDSLVASWFLPITHRGLEPSLRRI